MNASDSTLISDKSSHGSLESPSPSPVTAIAGANISCSSYAEVVQRVLAWSGQGVSRAIFFANVHMVMEAVDDERLRDLLNEADMVNPDGMPLVWALRMLGASYPSRVYGPDATLAVLAAAEKKGTAVGLYGGSPTVLAKLIKILEHRFPRLNLRFQEAPPFRRLTPEEDDAVVERVLQSEVQLLFVGLGCPKQERWIMAHKGRIPIPMLGVGAAFDFIAGVKPQAPRWLMRAGLEWAFRLATEPRRLAGRYLKHNPRFIYLLAMQLLQRRARLSPQ